MIDIRDLNKIILTNIYFLFLQSDIISQMIECQYITIVDIAKFFHQWLIRINDRNKFIVVSHKNQKQFNVTIMKFKNFFSYVQRQIDNLLHFHHQYVKAYVDDIVIFSKTLNEHLAHLRIIFKLLNIKDVILSIKKSFIDYSTITLLSQQINAFKLSTIIEKIDVIKRLAFSYTLTDLKLYLRLIEYLRVYILYYV